MKRKLCFTLAFSLILGVCPAAMAATTTATPSTAAVTIDGESITIGSYNIAGYTYFKLRDVAAALNDTAAHFEVGFDNTTKSISLTSDTPYTTSGSELGEVPTENATAETSAQSILLDGEAISLGAYNIDGFNYFQLRELSEFLDFDVNWDNTTKTIDLTTSSASIDENLLTVADLQQIIDDATSDIITIEGNFQSESSEQISITSGCTITSETGAALTNIAFVVDTDETVVISNLSFDGTGSDSASLQLLSVGSNSRVENCSFANYAHEAVLIQQIPSTATMTIQQCHFFEYGLADGGVDGAILAQNDNTFDVLLAIQNNTFQITREDSDMTESDMDVAFMTATNSDAQIVFGQLNLYFTGNTITKGSKTYTVDVYADYKKTASQLA